LKALLYVVLSNGVFLGSKTPYVYDGGYGKMVATAGLNDLKIDGGCGVY
jgi:hypothetical protein